jgi:hypothetical protein
MTQVVTAGDYALGCAGVVAIAVSLGFASFKLRQRLLPTWEGAPARLAETVLAVGALILICQLLGLAHLLYGAAIVATSLAIGACTVAAGGGSAPQAKAGGDEHPPANPPTPKWHLGVAITIALLVMAQWSMPTFQALDRGIYGGDSLWYHLPFAATFAQSHSITALHFTDPLYLNWFYPQNSELLHAAGIGLFGNDFLSPLINLGWLALALLAAWCIGRPYGNGAISLTGVAILLSADLMFSRQPGNANNDIVGLALMLAAVALLLQPSGPERDSRLPIAPALAIAGFAAGLALGTKLTFLVPIAALTVGVIAVAASGARRRAALVWTAPLLAGGGLWYARNLIVAGNPLPWQKLGIGPVALPRSEALEGRDPFSVVHYATDTSVWRHFFFPGLHERFGDLWPLVMALAALAVIAVLVRGGRTTRMLALVVIVTAVAYVLTPLSASGPEGHPLGFRLNLRYLAPALALGLALLAAIPPLVGEKRREAASAGILGLLVVVLLAGQSPLAALDDGHLAAALVIAAAAGLAIAIAIALAGREGDRHGPGRAHTALLAGGAVAALAILAAGWPVERDYEKQRYALDAPGYPTPSEHPGAELAAGLGDAYQWARDQRGQRIALGGTTGAFFQYGLYGPDSSNRVRYIGARGPRGSFDEVTDCQAWRTEINDGGYGFVVTTPGYDQDMPDHPLPARFERWTATDPAATLVLKKPNVSIFRIDGELDPARCE